MDPQNVTGALLWLGPESFLKAGETVRLCMASLTLRMPETGKNNNTTQLLVSLGNQTLCFHALIRHSGRLGGFHDSEFNEVKGLLLK